MFDQRNIVRVTQLATNGTVALRGLQTLRLSASDHVLISAAGVRYTSPTDFTITGEIDGDGILTWLNVTPLPVGTHLLGIAYIDSIEEGAAGGGSGGDASNAKLQEVIDAITALTAVMSETPAALPPAALVPLNAVGAPDMVPVAITSSSPFTIESADTDERWSVYGWVLTFTAACNFTIEGGSEDLVIPIPSAGVFDVYRNVAFTTTNVNQALTFTVSAGNATGAAYVAKAA